MILDHAGWTLYEVIEGSEPYKGLLRGKCLSSGAKRESDKVVSWGECKKDRMFASRPYFGNGKACVGTCGTHGEFAGHTLVPTELLSKLESVASTLYSEIKNGNKSAFNHAQALDNLLLYLKDHEYQHTWDSTEAQETA